MKFASSATLFPLIVVVSGASSPNAPKDIARQMNETVPVLGPPRANDFHKEYF